MDLGMVPDGFDKKRENVTYGKLEFISYASKTTGTDRQCGILLPPDYDSAKTYPVLYLLHGIGGTHTEWLGGDPSTIIGNMIVDKTVTDLIIVMPNVRAMADDRVPDQILGQENINAFDNFINDLRDDLMPYIEANYPVKKGREYTAIAGLSMGGRESLFIGFSMPDTFGYIGSFSPAPGLLPHSGLNYAGQFKEEELIIPDKKPVPYYILICNGNNDSVVDNVPLHYHNVLLENGVEHDWYTIDGGHDFGVWKNGLYNFAVRIFK